MSQTLDAGSLDAAFREAVAAIDAGDVAALERLVAATPALVRERLAEIAAFLRSYTASSASQ